MAETSGSPQHTATTVAVQGSETTPDDETVHIENSADQPVVYENYDFGATGDVAPSHGGAGTIEIRNVIRLLEEAGIPSCVVGVHPLRYYGAFRVPRFWQLCVPKDKLDQAGQQILSGPRSTSFEPWPKNPAINESLLHTYPRFHLKGVRFTFFLVPSDEYLIDCDTSNCEKSRMGIPYPKLDILAQSLLDTQRFVDLEDLIDGMNLSEEWGEANLDLDRSCDVAYAERKNERIRASIPETTYSCLMEMNDGPIPLRDVWQDAVRGKVRRIGIELDREMYYTRFCPKGRGDPRLDERVDI